MFCLGEDTGNRGIKAIKVLSTSAPQARRWKAKTALERNGKELLSGGAGLRKMSDSTFTASSCPDRDAARALFVRKLPSGVSSMSHTDAAGPGPTPCIAPICRQSGRGQKKADLNPVAAGMYCAHTVW